MLGAVPVPRQLLPVEEHHEVGHVRAILPVRADLAHQVHAHRVSAQREEEPVAQAEDAGVAPDQIHGERHGGVAEDLAAQRDRVVADVPGARGGHRKVQDRHDDREQRVCAEDDRPGPAWKKRSQSCPRQGPLRPGQARAQAEQPPRHRGHQSSAARPRSANRPCGLRWMKRMMNTRTTIFASTAPATGSSALLARPSPAAAVMVPAS